MEIKKLSAWQEWLESDRIVGTAFLHKWNEMKVTEKFQAQAEGKPPRHVDLSTILPECDKMERKLGGHVMARVLDVEKVLRLMRCPEGSGSYTVHIEDAFLSENTGSYAVSFADGKVGAVGRTDNSADLEVTEKTFCQLTVGLITPAEAEYRAGTKISGDRKTLEQVFVKKIACAR